MMPLRRFEIHEPANIAEASEMLKEFGDDGRIYAGGTELLLAMKFDLLRYRHLVDVKVIPGLDGVQVRDGYLEIGAATTHYTLERSELVRKPLPVVAQMESKVANVRVRVTGSIGGNLCFAEPHSDPATLLAVLNASLTLESARGRREVPIDQFVVGAYETCLDADELLTMIRIPLPTTRQKIVYMKFQTHERPSLGLALLLELSEQEHNIQNARVAVGCMSPFPRRLPAAEKLLVGNRSMVDRQLQEAAEVLADEADLVDDYEGRTDYKRNLIQVHLRRAYHEIMTEGGNNPVHPSS